MIKELLRRKNVLVLLFLMTELQKKLNCIPFLKGVSIRWPIFYIKHITVLVFAFVQWMHTVINIKSLVLQCFSVPHGDVSVGHLRREADA